MRRFHQMGALWRAVFRSSRIDAALAEEMQFHIDRETEANIGRGMSPVAARRAAQLTFGSVDAAQETSRDDRPGALLRQVTQDVRYGVRLLRKSPVFGLSVIAIVALGIGTATTVFGVVHSVLLDPLPYREPDRLVSVWLTRNGNRNYPAAADAIELRQLHRVFQDVALLDNVNLNLVGDGEPQRLQAAAVSANVFSLLGTSAALGRTFEPGEDQAGRERVVVLSGALWRSRFAADRGIVGQQLRLNGALYTVVGIMPPEFNFPTSGHQAWVPHVIPPDELTRATTENYRIIARLAPDVTLGQARQEIAALAARLAATYGGNSKAGMTADAMLDDAVRDVRPALLLVLGAVAFLLAIACINLSNLYAARASSRKGEFAVRLALGASRHRLIAQSVAESAPVLALGGALGVVLALWVVRVFVISAPAGLPRIDNIALSAPVMLVSFMVLVLTGLAASLAPAIQAWRSDFTTVTKDGGRGATAGRGRVVARRAGVAMQIAFALPLLVAASLMVRSAVNVSRVNAGFSGDRVVTFAFEVSRSRHATDAQVADYYGRLLDAVRAVPGVANVGMVNRIPLGGDQTNPVHFENPTGVAERLTNVDTRTVSPEYFATLGIELVAGRVFTDRDDSTAPEVAIVDDRVARTVWPDKSAVAQRLRNPPWRGSGEVEVIGVVRHIRATGLEIDPLPQVYWTYRQWPQDRMVLAVRGAIDPSALTLPVIQAIRSVDPEQSVYNVRTMDEIVDQSLARRRLTTIVMAVFSALALLLSAVGIYGVVTYGVTQRLREFGIRIALGATRGEVTRLVVRQGTSMATVGAAVGLVLALLAGRVMGTLVYGVDPRDVWSTVGATAFLLLIAGVASYLPARRAAGVDPGVTLRSE
jgi:putative ABC transport system permease protein